MGGLGNSLKSILTLLPVDAQTALLSKLKISDESKSSPAGAILMGMYLLEYTGFPKYIDELIGEEHRAISEMIADWHNKPIEKEPLIPSTGMILSLMAADMIACPRTITPAYKFESLAEEWCTGPLLGIEPSLLNDDRLGRAMSVLGATPQNLQDILFKMIMDTAKQANIPLKKFILDTTLLQLNGKFKDAPKAVPGRGNNSYVQLIVSLAIASDSRLPVGFDVLAGNTSDSKTLPDVYESVNRIADDGDIEFLMDRIYPTPSNILFLEERKEERMVNWVSPLKMGLSEKRVREEINLADQESKWKPISYRSTKEIAQKVNPPISAFETTWTLSEKIKPDLEEGQKRRPKGSVKTVEIEVRCVFYRHQLNAEKEKENREAKLQKLEEALKEFSSKLNKWQYKELDYCKLKLHGLLKSYACVGKFVQYDLIQSESGIITLSWSWDTVSIEAEHKYDGLFALLTNYTSRQVNSNQLLTKYRSRDQIEVDFKLMKGLLDLERVLYQRPERIDVFIFLKVIAFFILAFLRSLAKEEGIKTTERKIQESMGDMLLTEITVLPLGYKTYSVGRDTELNKMLRKLFSLPEPRVLIGVLNEKEQSKIDAYIQNWHEDWKKDKTDP